ncbi:MAG TPA: prolyl-tRNA synthetase associated domain-containing protein [Clostridiaceae bacterium]|nr:prolyl-tRNA synthetase associated domain-containing protein [Clostridiaceae bacterium]
MSTIRIDETLFYNKPAEGNRLDKEIAVYDILEKLEIPYIGVDHDPAYTIEDCLKIEAVLGTEICKNLFLRNGPKTEFYLLLMSGNKKFITKNVSKQIGSSRLSFAEAEYMEKYLNITPGAVSILGLMNDKEYCVRLLMDKDIYESEYIGCHPCVNTSSLKIKTSDILQKFLPYTGHQPFIVEL